MTWKQSGKKMFSEDWQEREQAEYTQLVYRITKLEEMLEKYKAAIHSFHVPYTTAEERDAAFYKHLEHELGFVPSKSYSTFKCQLDAMKTYLFYLEK